MTGLLSKILTGILAVLMAVSVILVVMFYTGEPVDPYAAYIEPEATDAYLKWTYALAIIAVGVTLLFALFFFVKNFIDEPKKGIKSVISIVLFVIIILISRSMAQTDPIVLADSTFTDAGMLKLAGTALRSMYILFGGAVAALILMPLVRLVMNLVKK